MILGFLKQLLGGLLGNDASAAPTPQTNTSRRTHRGYDDDEKVSTKGGADSPASSIAPLVDTTELTADELGKLHRIVDKYHRTLDAAELERRQKMLMEDLFDMAKAAWKDDDYATSMPMFCELVLMGYEEAYAYLGIAIELGEGNIEYDSQLMFKCYQRGIEHKVYPALFRLGNYYFNHQCYDEARALYERAIAEGWNGSEEPLKLGQMYEEGLGVDPDRDLAIKYYRIADKMQDWEARDALDRLGATYDSEEFDVQLPNSELFKTAEELYSIGLSESQGLHANMPLAVAYYTASAAKGDARAAYELALIYNNSRLPLYDEAKAENFAKQAEQGMLQAVEQHPGFADIAGWAYWKGIVCQKNKAKARQALQVGIDRSEVPENSMWIMAQILHEEGKHEEAFRYAFSAAERGQGMAMFDVAKSYESGIGTTANLNEAIRWYKACIGTPYAASGDARARLEELGISV